MAPDLPSSGGERRILQLSASLAVGDILAIGATSGRGI
jgi:hypothetical protein